MITFAWIFVFVAGGWGLFYHRASLLVWTISMAAYLAFATRFSELSVVVLSLYWIVFAASAVLLNLKPLRRKLLTQRIFTLFRRLLPKMSATEKEALNAGTISWEGELFNGAPEWSKLLSIPRPKLTAEEQAFIDGPVEELCGMMNDWEMTHKHFGFTDEVWQFMKSNGFFAMIIPKKYGGLEFSAYAHAEVLSKIYGVSASLASTVSVPNSLGPAELLHKYGTEQQKNYYLPRLAKGEEIPCFALTGPEAGSDAGSLPDTGIVCTGVFAGKETIGLRLNWDKRYITLAPKATLLGLAFKMYDPEHLLSEKTEYGITCALIPTDLPGITIGRHHFPLNISFPNGPTQGKDVFVPIDYIIGGQAMAGQGWRMLVECLSVGRGISLPSSAAGGLRALAPATGAYARIRRQFNVPIGEFEGVEEALAKLGGYGYITNAALALTVSLIDQGEAPAIPSAIVKYHATEMARAGVIQAMDVHGGKGICLGPNNYLGRAFQGSPISITVEGANILTRNMIIFGQGAVRCHPHMVKAMAAAELYDSNPNQALVDYDNAFFAHMGYSLSNIARTLFLALTRGKFVKAPAGKVKRYYQRIIRFSSAFAMLADISMLSIGGDLKRRERLSARLGDVLSGLYLASAVLKKFEDDGQPLADKPLVDWSCRYLFFQIEVAIHNLILNFPNKFIAIFYRLFIFPRGRIFSMPSDRLDKEVAQIFMNPCETRDRFRRGTFTTLGPNNLLAQLEDAFNKVVAAETIEQIIRHAVRSKQLPRDKNLTELAALAVEQKLISAQEASQLLEADQARQRIIAVDDFAYSELAHLMTTRDNKHQANKNKAVAEGK